MFQTTNQINMYTWCKMLLVSVFVIIIIPIRRSLSHISGSTSGIALARHMHSVSFCAPAHTLPWALCHATHAGHARHAAHTTHARHATHATHATHTTHSWARADWVWIMAALSRKLGVLQNIELDLNSPHLDKRFGWLPTAKFETCLSVLVIQIQCRDYFWILNPLESRSQTHGTFIHDIGIGQHTPWYSGTLVLTPNYIAGYCGPFTYQSTDCAMGSCSQSPLLPFLVQTFRQTYPDIAGQMVRFGYMTMTSRQLNSQPNNVKHENT